MDIRVDNVKFHIERTEAIVVEKIHGLRKHRIQRKMVQRSRDS